MPLFLIERDFAEALELGKDEFDAIREVNEGAGIEWLHSFLSADRRKTYCLYQATCAADIREAARRLNIPADEVVEVSQVQPTPPS